MPYIIEGGCCQLCQEFAKNLIKEFDFLLFKTATNKRVDSGGS